MTNDVTSLFTDLVLEVFQFNGRLLTAGDQLTAPLGLTSARWQVLGALESGPLPVSGIARAMGLTRQSVQRTVDVLTRHGLLASQPNPDHKRAYLVALTDRGRTTLDTVTGLQRTWAQSVAGDLDPAALAATLDIIRTLRQRLETATPEGDLA